MDTIDVGESEKTNQSELVETLNQSGVLEESNPIEQTSVDQKSETQFNSFMSYHEGESSSLKDPSTVEQELSKSSEIECTVKNDSGVNDKSDISSHDNDMIAYDAKESSSPSIEISSLVSQRMNQCLPYSLKLWNQEGLVEIRNRLNVLVIHYCIG